MGKGKLPKWAITKSIHRKFYSLLYLYLWQTNVFSGNLMFGGSVSKVAIQLQPQPLMSCGVGMSFFTQTPPRNVLFMKVSLLCDRSSFDGPH